jgi:hypothetical protein
MKMKPETAVFNLTMNLSLKSKLTDGRVLFKVRSFTNSRGFTPIQHCWKRADGDWGNQFSVGM